MRIDRRAKFAAVEVCGPDGYRTLRARDVVVGLGSWSAPFLRPYGVRLNIYPAKGYSVTIPTNGSNIAPVTSLTDDEFKLVYSNLGDRLRIAGTAELSGYSRNLDEGRCQAILRNVRNLFPRAGNFEQAKFWTGLRPSTPSNIPYVGRTSLSQSMAQHRAWHAWLDAWRRLRLSRRRHDRSRRGAGGRLTSRVLNREHPQPRLLAFASRTFARVRCGRSYILPPMPTTPAPGCAAKASTIACACAIASAVGVNTSLIAATCAGMDRHLGGEAVAAGFLASCAQSGFVSEIDIDGVDCRHASGGGAGEAQACAPDGRDRGSGRSRRGWPRRRVRPRGLPRPR